jgi:predicted flavoprotein YhiN
VLLIDHADKPGKKILISGGGRCNFTNTGTGPENFLSENPHFAKSALSRYTQWDFLALVERHGIAWHEKTLGQLFCDGSARQIVAMLLEECSRGGVDIRLSTEHRRNRPCRRAVRSRGRHGGPIGDRDGRAIHSEDGGDGRGL